MNFDKEKFPSGSSLDSNLKEYIPSSRGRRSSADGLRETIFQAIFEKKLETDIGVEFAAPVHDPLNAEFATPATQAEDIVSTSTTIPSFEDSEVSRSQRRKKLRRSVSFDQALTIYPITPTSDYSFMSDKHGKAVKIENGDKEEEPKVRKEEENCSNPVSECPSESELTSEVTSISSKECLPRTDTQRYIEGTIKMLEQKEEEEKKEALDWNEEPKDEILGNKENKSELLA